MDEVKITLTYVDRMILESYKNLIEGLAVYMGDAYEFVLHSLEDYDHSVIKIVNGFHTGRTEGAPVTNLALSMLKKISEQEDKSGNITYFTKNKKGDPLKSTTITIIGENNRIIGLLCINFYINTPFHDVLANFFKQDSIPEPIPRKETFVDNIQELIEESFIEVREEVFNDPDVPAALRNKEIVRLLMERGVFNLKDAVLKVADLLKISKNTVYMHIRNITKKDKSI